MSADPTPLQERIRRARSLPAEWARRLDGETTMEQTERWRKRQDEQTAAIIAAEVRKAQADAWDEGFEVGESNGYAIGRDIDTDENTENPYREQED